MNSKRCINLLHQINVCMYVCPGERKWESMRSWNHARTVDRDPGLCFLVVFENVSLFSHKESRKFMVWLFNNKNMFFNVLPCRNTKSHLNTPGRIKESLLQVDWFRYHQKYETFLWQAKHDKSTLSLKSTMEFYESICEWKKLLHEKWKLLHKNENCHFLFYSAATGIICNYPCHKTAPAGCFWKLCI